MAVVGWVEAGMKVVVGRHAGHAVGRMTGDAGAFPECEVNTQIRPDCTTIQMRRSGWGRARMGKTSWEGLST